MSYAHDSAHAKILMEGLGGGVCLLAVHWHVQEINRQAYLPRIRATTLGVIGALLGDGLFELGTMAPHTHGFVPAADPGAALRQVRTDYVDNFDVFGWQYRWWLIITAQGRQTAEPLITAYRREP
ncbi:hypothetical protein [Mycobacteroides abscessus]|uniref:hypothetical protein n=1 Tax=Mycobacteroides abscessus TaxID=36809 RepID=UPI000241C506|nr:hypothetical protein [Mycobacteroides abscessus]EHM22028.1 hypothetical protein MMAS_03690 [Mycobacteroides abscessus subsp. massiliense CCUG 48898 = JCM 15300]EIV69290.1 hypothetical protein MMCCUG48898_0230 [Mycobacteroides abscessus subsp. massiliense CCUG 48898 = JCM 15300]MDM2402646.1 hypothetical protein [Mycobacteroides abscessus]MDM2412964.1 hypothetical protein [Mycobacteroides abscessus]ORA88168.1 hypothetical protein BST32_16505 [Mycobacteroides abscessus subsp. massiliense]